jgi:hypothetical protein
MHAPEFWEALGRVVGTFGFLEETLGRAIFALTATREYPAEELDAAFEAWLPTLKRALSDPLGGLIDSFGRAARDHGKTPGPYIDELLADLRRAATYRNVLCHGSWRAPDVSGRSLPLFVTKNGEAFATPVDREFLEQTQQHTVELVCAVINTVTHTGWQFPGTLGPGRPVL